MRIRSIKPEFYKHDGLASLPPLTRLLFTGLWCMADCEGRMEDRPKRIKAEVLPYDDCDVEKMLDDLAKSEFITRYEVKSDKFLCIPSFRRHQRINGKEAVGESRFPAPTGSKVATKGKRRGNNGETPEQQPESLEGKGREGKGDDGDWLQSLQLNDAYRHLNVAAEAGKARAWIGTKPRRKFTRAFFLNWLNRASSSEREIILVPTAPDQSRLGPTDVDAAVEKFWKDQ